MEKVIEKKIEWQAIHLRATLFPEIPFSGKGDDLLPKIKGLVVNKITSQPQSLEQIIESTYNQDKLILTVLPIKFDLILISSENQQSGIPATELLTLGGFSEAIKRFMVLTNTWLENLAVKDFNRVALGVEIVNKVKDRAEGYRLLSKLMPFEVNAEEYSEFNLQINKRKKYKFIERELNINRLIRWGVLKLNLGIQSVGDPKTTHAFPELNYGHIVMDINTVPYQGKFNNNQASVLINNFIELGLEISKKGLK